HYRGVIHEFVEASSGHSRDVARGFYIRAGVEGVRSRNPNKYGDDAKLLRLALEQETDALLRSRYTFYLAQSLQDDGDLAGAVSWYRSRAEMGGWEDEVYISLYRAAQLKEQLGWDSSEIIGTYLEAYEADPSRAEALHGAVRYCRRSGKHHQG